MKLFLVEVSVDIFNLIVILRDLVEFYFDRADDIAVFPDPGWVFEINFDVRSVFTDHASCVCENGFEENASHFTS